MNFDVFESIAGDVSVFSALFLGLFIMLVFARVGLTVISHFKLIQSEKIKLEEFTTYTIFLFIFLIIAVAFTQSI
ncbi:hypothetical protein CYQ88_08315 [Hydrogenovibrio sp. SC-1]|uniref:hypothetical protein n=1 Tax=Hydrogenovibrio sp. SC-1 TaxID=2065820 RepID=UPI000C7DE306|nr:hypothetical protein [Hydrogenovibrio sp. SC-1]PLA73958.1 hypothetical protein CYQ88_08315 [Hydrogenovibrio sp. SC-1]